MAVHVQWSETRYARNGPAEIAWDRMLGSQGDPLLLVMGLATSRFWWPAGLCQALADRGFAVLRYDQRDAGQSTRFPPAGETNPFKALSAKRGSPYTAEDMTDDATAVLDDAGWADTHVFGHSLGGQIAQRIALRHRHRVRSVVSSAALPSDVAGLGAFRYLRPGLLIKLARMKFPEGRDGDIALNLAVARAIASPAYPFDETAAREWIEREVDSGPRDTDAQTRQIGAQWHGPGLADLHVPTLVMCGDADPLLRLSGARATAARVDGAWLTIWPGVGHDLPAPLWPDVADAVRALADVAQEGQDI